MQTKMKYKINFMNYKGTITKINKHKYCYLKLMQDKIMATIKVNNKKMFY